MVNLGTLARLRRYALITNRNAGFCCSWSTWRKVCSIEARICASSDVWKSAGSDCGGMFAYQKQSINGTHMVLDLYAQ